MRPPRPRRGSVDIPHFRNTGEVRLAAEAYGNAGAEFARATGDLAARGYAPALGAIDVDEGGDTVTVHASGTTQVFFALSPRFTVPVRGAEPVPHGPTLNRTNRTTSAQSTHWRTEGLTMEIELGTWPAKRMLFGCLAVLALIGLALLGRGVTPVEADSPTVLTPARWAAASLSRQARAETVRLAARRRRAARVPGGAGQP